MCDYQCTSVSFIKLSYRIESNYFSQNRNALTLTAIGHERRCSIEIIIKYEQKWRKYHQKIPCMHGRFQDN